MTITIEGVSHNRVLRGTITRKLEALAGRRVKPTSVRIGFEDENGPKGSADIRCAVTVELPRRASVHVEDVASSHRLAFDAAFDSLERCLERTVEQGRDRRRRPKKYFVAKRLLSPDVETPLES